MAVDCDGDRIAAAEEGAREATYKKLSLVR